MKKAKLRVAVICKPIGIIPLLFASPTFATSIRELKGTTRSLLSIQTVIGFSTMLEL